MIDKLKKSNGSVNNSLRTTLIRGSIDDRRSMVSDSSAGSTTLCETRSNKTLTSTSTNQSQFRDFASHVGKIGDAEKRRKQASTAITQSNVFRKAPISKPIDYEKFVTEKSAQLENDCCRELLLFPRDDIAENEIYSEERTAIPSVKEEHLKRTQWLFTKDSLDLYSSPCKVISFKYSEYSGDYKRIECSNIGSLRYELDLLAEENTARTTNQKPSEIILEGPVTVIPVDASLIDTFRSEKKRYCIIRKYDHLNVYVELQKQPNVPSNQPPIEIKSVESTSKKGKQILHFYDNQNNNDKPVLLLGLDQDVDITTWVININRALKDREDSQSIGSSHDTCATSTRSAPDSESISSESSGASLRDSTGAHIWRGKNAVGKALQPPVIDRKNLFALYNDLEPLPTIREPTCSLLQKTQTKTMKRNLVNATNDEIINLTKLESDDIMSKRKLNIQLQLKELKCHVSFIQNNPEHFEPLFIRIYLFDISTGIRVTEEFKFSLIPQHLENSYKDAISTKIFGSPTHVKSSSTLINEIPYSILMNSEANKLICTLTNSEDVFVIVRVERLLSDCPSDIYGKTAIDPKNSTKIKKTMAITCNKLAKYRCSLAWTASPLFPSMTKPGFPSINGGWQLFKNEGKLTDCDLQKLLIDCIKTEKSGKVSPIPNAYINLSVNPIHDISSIPYHVSSMLLPLKPWHDKDSLKIPTFEMQSFCDVTEPYKEFLNLLYVYPINLAYGNQKAFTRARNLSVSVRFVSSIHREGANATCIIDRSNPCGPYLTSNNTAVQYHEANPQFNDEIKIQLPVVLDPTDHLLFSFTHVSVNHALSPKSDKETIETPVGFAWLPLARGDNFLIMNDDVQEFDLPVSATLSPGYIQYQSLNQNKGQKATEIKWLDNGKPLFKVRLRLVSSVFTAEEKLQAFFQSCQKLYNYKKSKVNGNIIKESTPANVSNNRSCSPELSENDVKEDELIEKIATKACKLFEVEITKLIPHFYVVLKRLLKLLPMTKSTETATKILSVTIGIVDCAHTSNYDNILYNFVRFYFSITTSDDGETTHESVCKYLVVLLESIKNETKALSKIFRQLWFFFDIIIKSMTQWLIHSSRFKITRRERFSQDYLIKIENLITIVVDLVTKNYSIPESNTANIALAYFLRCCLSLTDRYEIFLRIHHVVESYDYHASSETTKSKQSHIMRSLKLELLQILMGHEHLLPLSLPVLTDRQNAILRIGNINTFNEPHNNSQQGFISRFLAMFSSTPSTLMSTENIADNERFDNYLEHFYLSENYCSIHFLIGILIQELIASLREPRDYRPLVICLIRNLLAKHSSDVRYTDKASQSRIALLYLPLIQFAIDNIKEIDTTVKSMLDAPEVPSKLITTTWSALTVYDIYSSRQKQTGQNGIQKTTAQPVTNGDKLIRAPLIEKLSKSEVKDILICILYILSRIPKKTLSNIWLLQEMNNNANGLIDFLHLLELSLQVFSYPGRTYLLKAQTKKKHGMQKANATVNFQFGSERPKPLFNSYNSSDTQRSTLDSQNSTEPPSSVTLTLDTVNDDIDNSTTISFFKDCNLTQEVGITVLEIVQSIASEIAVRCNNVSNKSTDMAFNRLLLLYVRLLDESWPESVRLNALAALSLFVSNFASRFFYSGPMEPLSLIIEAMLLQLNSHFQKIQQTSAALLQAIFRKGYELSLEQKARETSIDSNKSRIIHSNHSNKLFREKQKGVEMLGRPGAQTSVALARLLGQNNQTIALANSVQFEKGLEVLESLINSQAAEKKLSPFENAVIDLIGQLKEVISATSALSVLANNPIRKADLHIQLADSYRGSARLRCIWFDTLADIYYDDKWYSESAVCHAHSLTIIAKELVARGLIKVDWSLFDVINDKIVMEENVYSDSLDAIQPAGFSIQSLTEKVEKLVQVLIQAERYEAVGPICRLAIPIYEKLNDYKALMSIYVELQQASSRAAEIKVSGKRHFGSYFRVVFYSLSNFKDEHKTEWIYREKGLTSLAEACENMVYFVQQYVKTKKVQAVPENKIDLNSLEDDVAYIQMTHVEPSLNLPEQFKNNTNTDVIEIEKMDEGGYEMQNIDPMNYSLHTNVRHFYYEETFNDETVSKDAPEMARLSLKRVYLTVQEPFPNTSRRQKVIVKNELILNPLELACEKLNQKASQIRRLLSAVGIPSKCSQLDQSGIDPAAVAKLDVKGLQCFLQGAVSPTVNVGVLAYAEAFTMTEQRERYGKKSLDKLIYFFKVLMTELQDGLEVNGKCIGNDQLEYQDMMRKSFTGMLERLKDFFGEQDFILKQTNILEENCDAAYVLNSIGGVNL